MIDIESVILGFSYVGIFGLMILNGFLSFPSSQILYIIVGYFVSTGTLGILTASILGAIGNTIGNMFMYEAVRAHGINYVKKFQLFREQDILKIEHVFKKRGLWFLFIGKLLPAIKVFIPIPAGLGKVHRGVFAMIMLSASWIWSLIFISIGYFFGKSTTVWKSYGIILMIVAGIVVFLFYRYMNSKTILKELDEVARN